MHIPSATKLFLLFIAIAIVALFSFDRAYATFSSNGSVITQSGTDTDLSGLAAISGVTTETVSNGAHTYTTYNIGTLNLDITGALTINPGKESLLVGATTGYPFVDVRSGGALTIGKETDQNGYKDYSTGTAMYFSQDIHSCCDEGKSALAIRGGGRLDWYGGEISTAGPQLTFSVGSTIRIYSKNAILRWRDFDPQNQVRQRSTDLESDGFTMIGGGDFVFIAPPVRFENYNPIHTGASSSFSSATPNQDITFRAYSGGNKGNTIDMKFWRGARPIFINAEYGSQLSAGPHMNHSYSYGVGLVYQELSVDVKDLDANPIEGAKLFIRDTNHGNREIYNMESHIVDNMADKVYTGISTATGEIPTQSVLLAANVVNTGNGDSPNTGNYAWDYRGLNNDNSDLFNIHLWAYGYKYRLLANTELKGANGTRLHAELVQDSNISESDQSVVAAYSQIDTLDKLYDRAKLWKIDNVEQPTIAEQLFDIGKTGIELKTDWSIVVDPTAPQAFAVDVVNKVVTVRAPALDAGTKFTTVKSTATITRVNGAQLGTASLVDTNGNTGSLSYSGVFRETASNDGTIASTLRVRATGVEFSSSITLGTDVTVANVPAGLSVIINRLSNDELEFLLVSIANNHTNLDDVSNLTISFADSAFDNAISANVAHFSKNDIVVDFNDPSIGMVYSGSFTESPANNGAVNGSFVATLIGDTFANTLSLGTDVTVANAPAGLTPVITRDSDTQVTITLTGNASQHVEADSITNMEVSFTDSAFVASSASGVEDSSNGAISVAFVNQPHITYEAVLNEAIENDGSVDGSVVVTLVDEVFSNPLTTSDIVLNNVPSGLTPVITRDSDTQATVTFTGQADYHLGSDDVIDLEITFNDSAFANVAVADINDAIKSGIIINFENPASLSYSGVFRESQDNDGTVEGVLNADLVGDIFNPFGNIGNDIVVSNVPDGLTPIVTLESDTRVSIRLSGAATDHASADSVANITVAFADSAFFAVLSSDVVHSVMSDGSINYLDPFREQIPTDYRVECTGRGAQVKVYSDSPNQNTAIIEKDCGPAEQSASTGSNTNSTQKEIVYVDKDATQEDSESQDQKQPTTQVAQQSDTDKDGITFEVESIASPQGDGNGDAIHDGTQSNVATNQNTASRSHTTLEVGGGCREVSRYAIKTDISITGAEFPLGMNDFELKCNTPGDTSRIIVYYDKQYDTSVWRFQKLNTDTNTLVDISDRVTYGLATVNGQQVTTVAYSVVDGGELDQDGKKNGVIVDPAGPTIIKGDISGELHEKSAQNDWIYYILGIVAIVVGVVIIARKRPKSKK